MKDGYYWVRRPNGSWLIAEIINMTLVIPGDARIYLLTGLEIGDYIETPDKYKE